MTLNYSARARRIRAALVTKEDSERLKDSRRVFNTMFVSRLSGICGQSADRRVHRKNTREGDGLEISIYAGDERRAVLLIKGRMITVMSGSHAEENGPRRPGAIEFTGRVPGDCTLAGPEAVAPKALDYILELLGNRQAPQRFVTPKSEVRLVL